MSHRGIEVSRTCQKHQCFRGRQAILSLPPPALLPSPQLPPPISILCHLRLISSLSLTAAGSNTLRISPPPLLYSLPLLCDEIPSKEKRLHQSRIAGNELSPGKRGDARCGGSCCGIPHPLASQRIPTAALPRVSPPTESPRATSTK